MDGLTQAENDWGEPELDQRHFSEPNFDRSPRYKGPASDKAPGQAMYALRELLSYFGVTSGYAMPNPPSGLPGSPDLPGGHENRLFLKIGFNYALACLNDEPRKMHNLWKMMDQMIQKARDQAAAERENELLEKMEGVQQSAPPRFREPKAQLVYFIGSESGPIKIGIASQPIYRLKSLQTGHHERLELLATCEGGQPLEYAYHQRFAEHRLAGEWFKRTPELLAEIERLNSSMKVAVPEGGE